MKCFFYSNLIVGFVFTVLAILLDDDTILLLYTIPQIAVITYKVDSIWEEIKRKKL